MSYSASFIDETGYLHARFMGTHSPENLLRFLEETHEEGIRSGHTALLLEIISEGGSLGFSNLYRVISQRSSAGTKFRKIAYVDLSDRDPSGMTFAENVAANRGVNIRLFRDLNEARAWLGG